MCPGICTTETCNTKGHKSKDWSEAVMNDMAGSDHASDRRRCFGDDPRTAAHFL